MRVTERRWKKCGGRVDETEEDGKKKAVASSGNDPNDRYIMRTTTISAFFFLFFLQFPYILLSAYASICQLVLALDFSAHWFCLYDTYCLAIIDYRMIKVLLFNLCISFLSISTAAANWSYKNVRRDLLSAYTVPAMAKCLPEQIRLFSSEKKITTTTND